MDKLYGPYAALIKGTGMSQKVTAGSLGSFGHGSKAPFAYSTIRTVFYYTKIFNQRTCLWNYPLIKKILIMKSSKLLTQINLKMKNDTTHILYTPQ